MTRRAKPGIWAIESEWSSRATDVRSVVPVLEALKAAGAAKYVHQRVNSKEDFFKQVNRLGQKQYEAFTIGYVAMHGSPGKVHVGRTSIDLLAEAERLPPGRLASKVLHFGSCSVLTDDDQQQKLLECLGAKAVTGFTKDVDWFEGLAFEILLFEALTHYERIHAAENYIRKNFGELADRLGFVMVR